MFDRWHCFPQEGPGFLLGVEQKSLLRKQLPVGEPRLSYFSFQTNQWFLLPCRVNGKGWSRDQGCWPAVFLPKDRMQQHPPSYQLYRNLSWGLCFLCSYLIFLSHLPWAWRWGRGLFSNHCYLQACFPTPPPPPWHLRSTHQGASLSFHIAVIAKHLVPAYHSLLVLYAALYHHSWSSFNLTSASSFPRSCNDMSYLQTQT